MSDRFWDKVGRPYVLEGETIHHSIPEVRISGSSHSKSLMEIGDLKYGDLYVTNTRLIFIGEVRKAKDPRQKFDGLSIFYHDIDELGKVEKNKFSVLCVFKKGRFSSSKARIYFKKIPEDQIQKVTDYVRSSLQDIQEAETGKRPKPKEKDKNKDVKKPEEEKIDPDVIKAQALFSEIKEDSVELVCPACGGYVTYVPGMKKCPICGESVKFFPG